LTLQNLLLDALPPWFPSLPLLHTLHITQRFVPIFADFKAGHIPDFSESLVLYNYCIRRIPEEWGDCLKLTSLYLVDLPELRTLPLSPSPFKNSGFSEAQRRHFDRIAVYLETCLDSYVTQQLTWYIHRESPQIRDENYKTHLLL